jgi:hypothetical protein
LGSGGWDHDRTITLTTSAGVNNTCSNGLVPVLTV